MYVALTLIKGKTVDIRHVGRQPELKPERPLKEVMAGWRGEKESVWQQAVQKKFEKSLQKN